MAKVEIINHFGKMVGWSKVEVQMLGRSLVGIRKIAYGDELEKENEYGAGRMPIGESEGNYKPHASIELTKEEVIALQSSLPPGSLIQDIPPFPIVASYEYNGRIYKDVINNCSFTNNGTDVKQGDKSIATEFKLLVSHITYNA